MQQGSIFEDQVNEPLASRLRPENLEQVFGQTHLLGPGKILRELITQDRVTSMILWGPPGVGKTTLAQVIAKQTKAGFISFSAVTSGIKEIKKIMQEAEANTAYGQKTIVFVDEIHRFNKAQQDAFLPFVENGSIVLIGATTENPSFEINSALLSRLKVFVLKQLTKEQLVELLDRACRVGFEKELAASKTLLEQIAIFSDGDARNALNTLEMLVDNGNVSQDGTLELSDDLLSQVLGEKTLKYDKAIMPSKYTDEIENSSYTWRVFYMSRKSKYSAEQKLAILNELTRSNISEVAKKYAVGKKTIRTWGYLYEYQGIDGLRSTHNNHRYSREFKLSLVQQYQKSDESLEIFAIKHGLKSKTQLSDWIMQYNESNLKAYTPRKRDSKMSGRKTDFEERLTIIEELIRHDVNYNWAVEKYHISYQQVYGWYQKYRKSGNDPESLRDRRGKAKPEEKWTEVDRLKAENRLLRAQLEKQEMEIAFAKKLTEIRNREVEKDSGTKPSKN